MKQKFKQTEIDEIPEGWEECIFSEVVGVNPKRELRKGANAKFISMADLKEFNKKIQGFTLRNFSGGSKFINGDTLMARITPCLENGKTAFVDILTNGEVGCGSTEFMVLCGKKDKSTNQFVYCLATSPGIRQRAIKSMTGTSGRQRVDSDVFNKLFINLPSLIEQQAIAKILSDLDEKIELNHRMNKTLEDMGQALFKRWFSEEVDGWKNGTVEDVALLSRETINPNDFLSEKFEHYSIPAFDEGRLPKIEMGENIQSNKFIVPPNAILLSKLNPRIPRIWFPNVRSNCRSICSTEFLVTIPQPGITAEYLYGLFSSQAFLEAFTVLVTGTSSSHQRVKPEYLLGMELTVPPQEYIVRFSNAVKPFYQRVALNIEESRILAAIRDSLLPKLMSGKLRINS